MSEGVAMYLRSFRLPTMAQLAEEAMAKAEAEDWGYRRLLTFLCESEHQERQRRRIGRLLAESNLPPDKTLANLDEKLFPVAIRRQLASLLDGSFVDRAENIIAIGLPGRGKTHFLAALARELVTRQQRRGAWGHTYALDSARLGAWGHTYALDSARLARGRWGAWAWGHTYALDSCQGAWGHTYALDSARLARGRWGAWGHTYALDFARLGVAILQVSMTVSDGEVESPCQHRGSRGGTAQCVGVPRGAAQAPARRPWR